MLLKYYLVQKANGFNGLKPVYIDTVFYLEVIVLQTSFSMQQINVLWLKWHSVSPTNFTRQRVIQVEVLVGNYYWFKKCFLPAYSSALLQMTSHTNTGTQSGSVFSTLECEILWKSLSSEKCTGFTFCLNVLVNSLKDFVVHFCSVKHFF